MTEQVRDDLGAAYQEISDWLNLSAFKDWDIPELQSRLISRLQALGVRLYRMHIGMPTLHPLYTVGTYNWFPDRGVVVDNFARGLSRTAAWRKSPIRPFYEAGDEEGRIPIVPGSGSDSFPILKAAGANGATDYFVQLIEFPDRSLPTEAQEGIILSWITEAPGGFDERDLDLLRKIRLPFSAQLKRLAHRGLADNILDAYLGTYSARRVYSGQIQRGDGDVIDAVILFCDLRGSSKLAEHYSLDGFLSVLNDYYEITAGAVIDGGGEVLRYIGDASLAIFPLERFTSEQEACEAALLVAREAQTRAMTVNAARERDGEPRIEFGIGLHLGSVLYGNIGTASRIEFTVIGKAANEAARIEALCKELGETVLVSEPFSKALPHPWKSHGGFKLRNIGQPMEVLSPSRLV